MCARLFRSAVDPFIIRAQVFKQPGNPVLLQQIVMLFVFPSTFVHVGVEKFQAVEVAPPLCVILTLMPLLPTVKIAVCREAAPGDLQGLFLLCLSRHQPLFTPIFNVPDTPAHFVFSPPFLCPVTWSRGKKNAAPHAIIMQYE